ncbi:hypothetical protein DL98DRAFT_659204 [Cadophora sp. DSE1049]|nr:hypothetical protein DL98DRAFT_659204 [Cadophora sp. DSE1049]
MPSIVLQLLSYLLAASTNANALYLNTSSHYSSRGTSDAEQHAGIITNTTCFSTPSTASISTTPSAWDIQSTHITELLTASASSSRQVIPVSISIETLLSTSLQPGSTTSILDEETQISFDLFQMRTSDSQIITSALLAEPPTRTHPEPEFSKTVISTTTKNTPSIFTRPVSSIWHFTNSSTTEIQSSAVSLLSSEISQNNGPFASGTGHLDLTRSSSISITKLVILSTLWPSSQLPLLDTLLPSLPDAATALLSSLSFTPTTPSAPRNLSTTTSLSLTMYSTQSQFVGLSGSPSSTTPKIRSETALLATSISTPMQATSTILGEPSLNLSSTSLSLGSSRKDKISRVESSSSSSYKSSLMMTTGTTPTSSNPTSTLGTLSATSTQATKMTSDTPSVSPSGNVPSLSSQANARTDSSTNTSPEHALTSDGVSSDTITGTITASPSEKRGIAGHTAFLAMSKRDNDRDKIITALGGCSLTAPSSRPLTGPAYPGITKDMLFAELANTMSDVYSIIPRYKRATSSDCVFTTTSLSAKEFLDAPVWQNVLMDSRQGTNQQGSLDHAYEVHWLKNFFAHTIARPNTLTCIQANQYFFPKGNKQCASGSQWQHEYNFLQAIFDALASYDNPSDLLPCRNISTNKVGWTWAPTGGDGIFQPPYSANLAIQDMLSHFEKILYGVLEMGSPGTLEAIRRTNNRIYNQLREFDSHISDNPQRIFGDTMPYHAVFPTGLAGVYKIFMTDTILPQILNPVSYLATLWNTRLSPMIISSWDLPDVNKHSRYPDQEGIHYPEWAYYWNIKQHRSKPRDLGEGVESCTVDLSSSLSSGPGTQAVPQSFIPSDLNTASISGGTDTLFSVASTFAISTSASVSGGTITLASSPLSPEVLPISTPLDFVISTSSDNIPTTILTTTPPSSPSASPRDPQCEYEYFGVLFSFRIFSIDTWGGNGKSLHHKEKGCGLLTAWHYESQSDGTYEATFNLPTWFKAGCVERAIVSAGGPKIKCRFRS